jgi:hypothetical protein
LERAVGKNEKLESCAEVGKNRAKLERTERSWEEPIEVGKNRPKLERFDRSWKVFFKLESFAEVGKFRCSWKVLTDVGKLSLKLESVTALNYGTKG